MLPEHRSPAGSLDSTAASRSERCDPAALCMRMDTQLIVPQSLFVCQRSGVLQCSQIRVPVTPESLLRKITRSLLLEFLKQRNVTFSAASLPEKGIMSLADALPSPGLRLQSHTFKGQIHLTRDRSTKTYPSLSFLTVRGSEAAEGFYKSWGEALHLPDS